MAGFTKLFSSIVTSSLWCQDDTVLRVWIAMLATCDAHGMVEGSVPGFASLCRISTDEMERVLGILSGPDPHSRTEDHEGRRIVKVQGGWQVLNYTVYREKCQAKNGSNAGYQKAYRNRQKEEKSNALDSELTRDTEAEAEADKRVQLKAADAASESKPKKARRTRTEIIQGFGEDVKAVVNALGSEWKAEDPVDGRKITLDVATFAQRVSDILAQHQEVTPAVLIEAGQAYLGSSRNRYKAPQFFFGPGVGGEGPPWLGFVRAILTRKSLPEAS